VKTKLEIGLAISLILLLNVFCCYKECLATDDFYCVLSAHSIVAVGMQFLPRCMKCRRGLAIRILSACLSVRLSVKRMHLDKTEEKSVQIFTCIRKII